LRFVEGRRAAHAVEVDERRSRVAGPAAERGPERVAPLAEHGLLRRQAEGALRGRDEPAVLVADEDVDVARLEVERAQHVDRVLLVGPGTEHLCANQPVSWDVGAKLQNSLARSNRRRFG
jgi:hypothetical protein